MVRYAFNESSGTVASDSSGNGHHASLQNGASFVAGARGNAVRISGGTQRVVLPNGVVERCEDLTIAARVNLASNSANWARIFDIGSGPNANMFLTPRAGASNVLRFAITTGGGAAEQQISYTYSFPTGAWEHVAVVLAGNTGTMYLDGVQVAQNTNVTLNPWALGLTTQNWLGDSQYAADPTLNGSIDDFVVSCRAYSASEVAWLANGSDPVAQYLFNEASGTTAFDSSGNVRHATLASGASFVSGLSGNAVQVAGGSQRVNLPTGIVQSCTDLTIAAHVRLITNATNWARIFDIGADTTRYMMLTPRAGASNVLRFAITTAGNGAEQRLSSTYNFPTNTWKHVAVVLSGNTGIMYVDGVQVAQNTSLTLNPNQLGATVNNWLGDSQFAADPTLNGTIDNLLISCRPYSPAEIGALAETCATSANCNDGRPCTTDACNAGFCSHSTAPNGTSCADGNLCNGGETCQTGSCVGGTPPVVDDGNACTTDACDPMEGVTHTPIPGCGTGGAGGAGGSGGASGGGGTSGSGGSSGGGGVACPSGTTSVEMFIELPPDTPRSQIAIGSYGPTPLELHDRVRVLAPGGTTFASASSLSASPTVPTRLGVEAHVQNLFGEPNIELRDRSHVHGNAVSPGSVTLFPQAVVDGQTIQQALTPRRRESWIVCHPNSHQGNIDLQPGQVFPTGGMRLPPGAWGTLAVKTSARIRLRGNATYFFESIAIEPGGIVDLDTAAGGIQLYFRNGGFFRGVQQRTDTRANVLFGMENGSFTINGSFRGTVVAPRGLVELPTATGGHQGSFYGAPVIVRPDANVTHEPTDTTGMCPPGVCNGLCPCDDGGTGCQLDQDCAVGLVCLRNTCVIPDCLFMPILHGCGFPGAKCGDKCTTNPPCASNQDCPAGLVCPQESNGWKYGVAGLTICERPDCTPEMCGAITSECGLCDCQPDCGAKNCGDPDLSDGCRGRCSAVCEDGEPGCALDSDCHAASVCIEGTCRPAHPCASPDLAPPDCGPGALCGDCATPTGFSCADRECGTDPVTGSSCGQCSAGFFCASAGRCALIESIPPIEVPVPGGGTRPVTADGAPPAGFVGTVPGAFDVTDRGSAQYTIPIEVPPGRSIQPELALRYTSSTGNGALGVGWSLDGLSVITRCARTFAQDGYSQPVTNTTSDALCLDGQRLVLVSGQDWSHGAEYRTAVDTFDKVVLEHEARYPFTVYKRDGRIFFYGDVDQAGLSDGWPLALVRDRSGNFMRITYRTPEFKSPKLASQANLPGIAKERVPASITYTGFGSTDGDREVRFSYRTRTDKIVGYRPGGTFLSRVFLLEAIEVWAQNQLVRRYALSHEVVNDSTFLKSVQMCAGPTAQACKPPTTFDYYNDELGFGPGEQVALPTHDQNGSVIPEILPYGIVHKSSFATPDELTSLNVTTDVQLVYPIPGGVELALNVVPVAGPWMSRVAGLINQLEEEAHTSSVYRNRTFSFASTNAFYHGAADPCDNGRTAPLQQLLFSAELGKETIHSSCLDLQTTGRSCAPVPGGGFDCDFASDSLAQHVVYYPREWFVDVDGDGVQDRIACQKDANMLSVFLSKAYRAPQAGEPADFEIAAYGDLCNVDCGDKDELLCAEKRPVSLVFDVDGDGTGNLVVHDEGRGRWAALFFPRNEQPIFREDWFIGVSLQPHKYYTVIIDANGDGLRDILALPDSRFGIFPPPDAQGGRRPTLLLLNTGRGFVEQRLQADDEIAEAPVFPAFVLDYDHDGIEELIEAVSIVGFPPNLPPPWRLRKIRGGRILTETVPSLPAGPGVIGDFDGDGDIDVITQGKETPIGPELPFMRHLGRDHRYGLLKRFTDGLGRQVEVDYTRKAPQGEERPCIWPYRCAGKLEVAAVTSRIESHYMNQARTQRTIDRVYSYDYEGPIADMAGYGWLGFRRRTITVRDALGADLGETTVFYKNPPAWVQTEMFTPYTYSTAGRIESMVAQLPGVPGSDFDGAETGRTSSTMFEWQERPSISGLPFAFLASRRTTTSVNRGLVTGGTRELHQRDETFVPDVFGNVTLETSVVRDLQGEPPGTAVPGSEIVTKVERGFVPNQAEIDEWLIARPKTITVTNTPRCASQGECIAKTQIRNSEIIYYPETTLPRFVYRELGSPELERSTELVRDPQGNVRQVITVDIVGELRESRIDYDERALLPISMSQVGEGKTLTTQVRYDDRFGTVIAEADPNGIDATSSYDEFGVFRHYRGPSGEHRIDYTAADLYETSNNQPIEAAYRVTSTETGGEISFEEYNAIGLLVRRKNSGLDAVPVYEEFGYDSKQLLRFQSRPHLDGDLSEGFIEYAYDARGRMILETYPDGGEVRHDYGVATNPSSQPWNVPGAIDAVRTRVKVSATQTNATIQVTDRDGLPVNIVDALDQSTRYFYAAFGNVERIVDPAGRAIEFTHDAYGRMRTVTDAARGGTEITHYNGLDEVIETRDAANRIRSLNYDGLGRLTQVGDTDGITSYIYDGAGAPANELGRLVQTVSPTNQTTIYGYEPPQATQNRGLMNRVTQQLFRASGDPHDIRELTTVYTFNQFSRLERIDYPSTAGAFAVQYGFDVAGHTNKAFDANAPATVHWQILEAEQGYRIKRERLGNAPCGGTPGTTTERGYDPLNGRLTSIKTTCGTAVVQELAYDYDLAGNMTLRADVTGSTQAEIFGYDPLNRLTTINGVTHYTYDSREGRLHTQNGVGTYAYKTEGRDWLATAGPYSYDHDAVGNVIERSGSSVPGGTQTIDYTAFDLPRRVTSGGPGGPATQFGYDADGQRVLKETPSTATFYAGDLFQRTEHSAGTIDDRFMVYAGGRAIAQATSVATGPGAPPATVNYLYDDAFGSVQTVTNANGAVQEVRDYGPFGALRGATTSTNVPYGYTGHEEDADLGLVNMKGRIYDQAVGQFMQADPIVAEPFSQGLNRYAYVNNSPMNFVDPSGFATCALGMDCSAVGPATFGAVAVVGIGVTASVVYNPLQGGAVGSSGVSFSGSSTIVGGGASGGGGTASGGSLLDALATPEAEAGGFASSVVLSLENLARMSQAGPAPETTTAKGTASSASSNGATPGYGRNNVNPVSLVQEPGLEAYGREIIEEVSAFRDSLPDERVTCKGIFQKACGDLARSAANSPAGRWAQRHAAQLAPRIADIATRLLDRLVPAARTISPKEVVGLRNLFGKGVQGAESLLGRLRAGESVPLPEGVTRGTLENYRGVATRAIEAGKDKLGVQALRREAIDLLLK
jgi:RHS repeat-associated protein